MRKRSETEATIHKRQKSSWTKRWHCQKVVQTQTQTLFRCFEFPQQIFPNFQGHAACWLIIMQLKGKKENYCKKENKLKRGSKFYTNSSFKQLPIIFRVIRSQWQQSLLLDILQNVFTTNDEVVCTTKIQEFKTEIIHNVCKVSVKFIL